MKIRVLAGIAAPLLSLCAAPLAAETIAIHAGNVITDADSEPIGQAVIFIEDGVITAIRKGEVDTDVDRDIDLSGMTILPGLIDLHTHLSGDPSGEYWRAAIDPNEWYAFVAAKNAKRTVEAGFTTVRDVGSRSGFVTQALRRATAQGLVPGPRVVTSGRTLSIIGGHGDVNGFREDVNAVLSSGFTCTGAVECAAKVRLASKNGADLIKITATGGVLSQQGRGLGAHFTFAEMKSIADTAHSLGLKVAAHAHGARGIELAARAGIDTIEHGTYIDEAAAKAMRENGTVLVPTLMAFQGVKSKLGKGFYTPVVEAKIRAVSAFAETIIQRARKWGVKIAFGTDAGVYPHGQNAHELALMRKGGMSNREVLASATSGAAKVLGLEDQIGRLAPGYSADIIALEGNPLDDVARLEHVDFVMVRGRVMRAPAAPR